MSFNFVLRRWDSGTISAHPLQMYARASELIGEVVRSVFWMLVGMSDFNTMHPFTQLYLPFPPSVHFSLVK